MPYKRTSFIQIMFAKLGKCWNYFFSLKCRLSKPLIHVSWNSLLQTQLPWTENRVIYSMKFIVIKKKFGIQQWHVFKVYKFPLLLIKILTFITTYNTKSDCKILIYEFKVKNLLNYNNWKISFQVPMLYILLSKWFGDHLQ